MHLLYNNKTLSFIYYKLKYYGIFNYQNKTIHNKAIVSLLKVIIVIKKLIVNILG